MKLLRRIIWVLSLCASVGHAATVAAGTLLELRLRQNLSSYSSKQGQEIRADLIAPVRVDGHTLLPQGSLLSGTLTEVKRIGWGARHLRASMRLTFNTIALPDGTTHELKTRIASVDNARETVDKTGKIVGIRATAPMGHRLAGITRNIFIWDPLLQMVLTGSTAAVLRFPEAEIYFPAGTEMFLALTEPLEVDTTWSTPMPRITTNPEDRERLLNLVRGMTFRTIREKNGKPGDFVNVVFLGEPEWVDRAFTAAGWLHADKLSKSTGWMSFRAVAEAKPYPNAPMSGMLLDEKPAVFQYTKALNSYSKRHHLRVFDQADAWNQRPILAASSTQDVAVTFSFSSSRLIHVVDRNIDNERAKIVNDLAFTGCVDAAELIERPWVPQTTKNYTGEVLETDGAVAVLEINPCRTPLRTLDPGAPLRVSGGRLQRVGRQVMLTAGNDFTFNNPIYQAGKGIQFLFRRMLGREDRTQPTRTALIQPSPRSTDIAPAVPVATMPD
ncbi:LssY C-terminal domain-containing protein [uncultured Paludibaculum sp.]|uniref:LssY C-terminal domain-containing protein n=1 Tax=uncultured Paludibaculum sp. TaxID=1765020 RepID=UPI002AABDE2A|nr:LssY C-terminal domain-containing protein [uncultured Paludibaculum sp.]